MRALRERAGRATRAPPAGSPSRCQSAGTAPLGVVLRARFAGPTRWRFPSPVPSAGTAPLGVAFARASRARGPRYAPARPVSAFRPRLQLRVNAPLPVRDRFTLSERRGALVAKGGWTCSAPARRAPRAGPRRIGGFLHVSRGLARTGRGARIARRGLEDTRSGPRRAFCTPFRRPSRRAAEGSRSRRRCWGRSRRCGQRDDPWWPPARPRGAPRSIGEASRPIGDGSRSIGEGLAHSPRRDRRIGRGVSFERGGISAGRGGVSPDRRRHLALARRHAGFGRCGPVSALSAGGARGRRAPPPRCASCSPPSCRSGSSRDRDRAPGSGRGRSR